MSSVPNYDKLRSDATSYYLANGGTQANVDAYFKNDPSYDKLAKDATGWYTDQNRGDQNTDWDVGMPGGPTKQNYGDVRNTNVANYFGFKPPPAGTNFNIQYDPPTTPAKPNTDFEYPASWVTAYQNMDSGTQDAVRSRYSGMTVSDIMKDWDENVQPRYADGTTYDQILRGAPTAAQMLANQPPRHGGRGSLSAALASPGDYYNRLLNDPEQQKRWAKNNWVGGDGSHEAAWAEPHHTYPGGEEVFAPGYARGSDQTIPERRMNYRGREVTIPGRTVPGEVIQWSGRKPPTNSPLEDYSGTGNVLPGMAGQPLPDFVQRANTRFRLTPPGPGGTKQQWDTYVNQLAYYMPDIEADWKAQNPGNNDNPWTKFMGQNARDLSPLF